MGVVREGLRLVPGGTPAATGLGPAVDPGVFQDDCLRAYEASQVARGFAQTSMDNGVTDAWRSLGSAYTQATGVTSQRIVVGGTDRWVRASYTIGGTTPSFTWSLVGEAV